MPVGAGAADVGERVPQLAEGCDPKQLALSPEEGFLLSRIDGQTSLDLLREIVCLPRDEVDRCIAAWADAGIVVFAAPAAADDESASGNDASTAAPPEAPPAPRNGAAAAPPAPGIDEGLLDPGLEIPVEAQRRVLERDAALDRPYHEILGVSLDADARAIKRAYFALSKEFHPDRYFRREIGPYADRLERVFRKLAEAYELLSDPTVRAEMARSLGDDAAPDAGAPAGADAGADEAAAPEAAAPRRPAPRRRRPLSPFSPLGRLLAQRRAKAKGLFEAAMAAVAEERWMEAAGSLRLAIAFDPHNEAYRERFGEVRPQAHAIRFEQLMKEAESALSFRDRGDALRLFEDALHYRPWDPRANHVAAKLAWLSEDLHRAKEYAQRACEAEPDDAGHHKLLGQIYAAAGLTANARRELRAALKIEPRDAETKAALKAL